MKYISERATACFVILWSVYGPSSVFPSADSGQQTADGQPAAWQATLWPVTVETASQRLTSFTDSH